MLVKRAMRELNIARRSESGRWDLGSCRPRGRTSGLFGEGAVDAMRTVVLIVHPGASPHDSAMLPEFQTAAAHFDIDFPDDAAPTGGTTSGCGKCDCAPLAGNNRNTAVHTQNTPEAQFRAPLRPLRTAENHHSYFFLE